MSFSTFVQSTPLDQQLIEKLCAAVSGIVTGHTSSLAGELVQQGAYTCMGNKGLTVHCTTGCETMRCSG